MSTVLKAGDIDRHKVCPLLLRLFHRANGHHRPEEFENRSKLPVREVKVHTWKDATLRELSELIYETASDAKVRGARLEFAFIYPDKTGRMVVKEVGGCSAQKSSRPGPDDDKTLDELHFETGDYIDVAIVLPRRGDY